MSICTHFHPQLFKTSIDQSSPRSLIPVLFSTWLEKLLLYRIKGNHSIQPWPLRSHHLRKLHLSTPQIHNSHPSSLPSFPLEIRQQIYREVVASFGWGKKLHILYRSVKIANEEAIRQKKHVMYYHTWQWQLTYTPCTLPPNYQKPIYVRQDPLT
jgi:hypothetical protein